MPLKSVRGTLIAQLLLLLRLSDRGFFAAAFESTEDGNGEPHARVMIMGPMAFSPRLMIQGMPPPSMVMKPQPAGPLGFSRGLFGHDPFEDMFENIKRVFSSSADSANHEPAKLLHGGSSLQARGGMIPTGNDEMPLPLLLGLTSMLSLFSDDQFGHFGRSEGSFSINTDKPTQLTIRATLPGYNLTTRSAGRVVAASESPLQVQAIGERSLVVKGSQARGGLTRMWQRTFALPPGVDLDHIHVTYANHSGNLTIVVPRTEVLGHDGKNGSLLIDDQTNPVAKAFKDSMPKAIDKLKGAADHSRKKAFLRASRPQSMPELLSQIMDDLLDDIEPRKHALPGGEKPPPDDAQIEFVGCYAESQLKLDQGKVYGGLNGAGFNNMYWHAVADHADYMAMARHDDPSETDSPQHQAAGQGFTWHGPAHHDEAPKWGVSENCGSVCADDEDRWCGCANRASAGSEGANPACLEAEKRFAIYKINSSPHASRSVATNVQDDASEASKQAAAKGPSMMPAATPQAYWKLTHGDKGADTAIDIMIPKGQVAELENDGVFNIFSKGDTTRTEQGRKAITSMKLPVNVSARACTHPASTDNGGSFIRCQISSEKVKTYRIDVIEDEL